MDARTGEIHHLPSLEDSELKNLIKNFGIKEKEMKVRELKDNLIPMAYSPTINQMRKGRVSRNDPCGCGSGEKFKKCCLFIKIKTT